MKPAPFAYHVPATLAEAFSLRAATAGEGVVLAGGQSLLPILNLRLAAPAALLDVVRLTELDSVSSDGARLRVGACVRQRAAERSEEVASACPLLSEALPWIGHPSTRNRGTIGGSIAHADPAAELPVVTLALDAVFVVRSESGERAVAATEFFRGFMSTALQPDELLLGVELGALAPRTGSEHGVCGACTVLLDGEPSRSCITLAVQTAGARVETVESLGSPDDLHPLQRAFRDAHSFQCGFCTPGFVIESLALLRDTPTPTEREVREALAGNICRCTGYESIVRGVLLAAERMEEVA